MSEPADKYEEPALEQATIYRGPQSPALQFYVPLPVFIVEAMLLLAGMRLVGFWIAVLIPLHLVLAWRTSENPYWIRDLTANLRHRWIVDNKGLYQPGIVTFTPHTTRKEIK